MVILMPPPHKSKELFQLVDTLSQVSAKMVEASLEGIPTNISPIAMTTRSGSVTPLQMQLSFGKMLTKPSKSC